MRQECKAFSDPSPEHEVLEMRQRAQALRKEASRLEALASAIEANRAAEKEGPTTSDVG